MRKFCIPYIPYRSLLLSTTVLNDNISQKCTEFQALVKENVLECQSV